MKYNKIYQQLKKKYSDAEIADAMMIPADLTAAEEVTMAQEMKAIRFQKLSETTEEDRILADVMRLRFNIEAYLKSNAFLFDKTFGKYLEEYIRILKKSRKAIAEDLALHYTKLSRIINDKEEPSIALCYRLEKHTGNLIKARLWWQLLIKKQAFILEEDEATRIAEQNKVKNALRA